jgi:acyl-CoA reductase-like NAD-dependent aldehyde dehydrogenase
MRVSVFVLQLFINNKWVDPVKPGEKLDVVDPRTGDTIKQLANAGQQVPDAVTAK